LGSRSRVFLAPWSRSRLKKKTRSRSRLGKKSGAGAGAAWKKVRSRSWKKICRLPSPAFNTYFSLAETPKMLKSRIPARWIIILAENLHLFADKLLYLFQIIIIRGKYENIIPSTHFGPKKFYQQNMQIIYETYSEVFQKTRFIQWIERGF